MGGRRNEKKEKKREEEGIQGERKKKKSSVGFKPARLFLLVSCLCNGRGWLEGLVSLFSLPGSHSLLFCRCGPWQSIRPLISQSSSFVLGTRKGWLQPLWLACARSRGIQPRWVWVALKQLCAWSSQPADPAAWAWDTCRWLCAWKTRSQLTLCLGGRSSRPGLESLGRAGPPWD